MRPPEPGEAEREGVATVVRAFNPEPGAPAGPRRFQGEAEGASAPRLPWLRAPNQSQKPGTGVIWRRGRGEAPGWR